MRIVQLTPGAGGMICGNCLHDNALVGELGQLGHDVTMLPLYLPLRVDEDDHSIGNPIFFGGLTVYFSQHSALFRTAPSWLRRMLNSRLLLGWAASRAAKTRAEDVGDVLLSMLRGEQGNQNREITELVSWLKQNAVPDVLCLSNALLVGMVRRLKAEFPVPVVCLLQGEEPYLDALPTGIREAAWAMLEERGKDIDAWIAPSQWNATRMTSRLAVDPLRMHVVHDGINPAGYPRRMYSERIDSDRIPVLGYFARMCKEKGLDLLVDAYIQIKRRGHAPRLQLRIGGWCGPVDEPFMRSQLHKLHNAGYADDVKFYPNIDRPAKIEFLSGLDVFSVPAHYGEAFGLYLIEALASGVPVVQPRTAAFPEIIAATGGGILCDPGDPTALGKAIEELLMNPARAHTLGMAGQQAVYARFNARIMAQETAKVFEAAITAFPAQRPVIS